MDIINNNDVLPMGYDAPPLTAIGQSGTRYETPSYFFFAILCVKPFVLSFANRYKLTAIGYFQRGELCVKDIL